jgi:hypothetical protein
MEPALWPTLADAARLFESRGISFALIGGLAVSLRGQPRMTVDVDVVIVARRLRAARNRLDTSMDASPLRARSVTAIVQQRNATASTAPRRVS